MAKSRLVGSYPVIGIRPTIDGRRGALDVRGSLEEQTMNMAKSAAKLFEENLRYSNGEPVKVVIADTTIGRVGESAACADKFRKEGVDITLTVTPCWCYGAETMDMDPQTIKAVWGFNGTERPGAVYLASVLATHAQKGLPAFGIYGHDVQEADDTSIPADVEEKLLRFGRAAVAAADGMNELDAIKLVRRRGILMQSTVPAGEGAMAAVLGLDAKKIEEILESFENVWIANYNCPGQIVITGLTNEVQQASLALKEAGAKRVVELKVSGPFHSLLLKPAGEALLKEMESMSFSTLQVPYVANATAEIVTDSKKISTFFAKGIYSSVRWQQSIETMLENGVDTFVEIGPGKTLAGFMRKIAPKATVYNVSSFEDAIALEKCLSKA